MIFPPIPVSNYGQILVAEKLAAEIKPFKPVDADSGRETWFEGSGALVCLEPQAWTQVWNRHVNNQQIGNVGVGNLNSAPAVDFKKNLVVALFAGPSRGVLGYRVVSGFTLGKEGVLRLQPVTTNSNVAAIAVPSPWAFLVLPRTKATISIQLPAQNGWNTVVKVPPTLEQ